MRAIILALCIVGASLSLNAQSYTVAVFASNVTNPNTGTPVRPPVAYTTPLCNQTKASEVPPITNPNEGRFNDPAAPTTKDCLIDLTAQVNAIPAGSGYRGAIKTGTGVYGPLTTAFAVALQAVHPCDGTPVSRASVLVGQAFEYGWCHDGKDTNGNSTTVTSWKVYRNGVVVTATVTTDAGANAQGLLYSHTSRSEAAAGSVTYEVSALNSTGESVKAVAVTVTANQPLSVPTAPVKPRIP